MAGEVMRTNRAGDADRELDRMRLAVAARRDRVSETLQELEERLLEEKTALTERLDVARPVREYVNARPLAAVGIAAGAGLLIGLLTAGSRRHREQELMQLDEQPSRFGQLVRSLTHELAGAATAMLVSRLAERLDLDRD